MQAIKWIFVQREMACKFRSKEILALIDLNINFNQDGKTTTKNKQETDYSYSKTLALLRALQNARKDADFYYGTILPNS